MDDIRDIVEMMEPTTEVISGLVNRRFYIVLLKEIKGTARTFSRSPVLLELEFREYSTVPPKFVSAKSQQRFTMEEVDYIFKLKEK